MCYSECPSNGPILKRISTWKINIEVNSAYFKAYIAESGRFQNLLKNIIPIFYFIFCIYVHFIFFVK